MKKYSWILAFTALSSLSSVSSSFAADANDVVAANADEATELATADKADKAASPAAPTKPARESISMKDIQTFTAVMRAIQDTYVEQTDSHKLIESAIRGMLSGLDPHSEYLDASSLQQLDEQTAGEYAGLGVEVVAMDGVLRVISPIDDSPAFRAGVKAGDSIVRVDGKVVTQENANDSVESLRGLPGSQIALTLRREGQDEPVEVSLTREVIKVSSVKGRMLEAGYAYVRVSQFQQETGSELREKLRGLAGKGTLKGLVLDLRSNGGGLLGDAVEMVGELIDEGPVVQVQDSRGQRDVLSDDKPGTDFDGKVVVLVDRFSASASEIVAGALQDYGRALIVGTGPTHGKGTVQTLVDLDRQTGGKIELGSIKLTIQQFFRVTGSSTQREGVTPDIVLPDPAAYVESGERELDHAIAWSQIGPATYKKLAPGWKLDVLTQKSATRVAKHPVLAKVATATAALKARRNDTRVPLARAAYEARRKEQRAAADAASLDLKSMPATLTVKLLDEPKAAAAPAPANGNGKANGNGPEDRLTRWRDNLSRDPWVEECLSILADAK